ncbi:MAG: hypothetical protein QG663_1400 [Thermodesulfobacteriota bacterium]|nr:hypothetical protein [Thermodesulfobacteriota bacterium]
MSETRSLFSRSGIDSVEAYQRHGYNNANFPREQGIVIIWRAKKNDFYWRWDNLSNCPRKNCEVNMNATDCKVEES